MTDASAEPSSMREAFSLLGHDIRLDILVALLDDWEAAYTDPVPYAELMDAVGVTDSGKFNYHLGKLRGAYVRKVDGGYVPTAAATALYRAVVAHQPDHEMEQTRFDVDSDCPRCHAALVGRFERGFLSVDCDSCGDWIGFSYPFPRNGFTDRSNEAAVRAAHRRCKHHLAVARAGQCPFCAGATTVDIREDAITDGGDPAVEIACNSCSFHVGSRILFPLLLDAQVVTMLSDVGIDVEQYEWEFPEPTTRIAARDPLRIRVEVPGDKATTNFVLDGRLDVCSGDSPG